MTRLLSLLLALAALGVLALGAAAAVVFGGLYDVAADRPHWQATYTLLETTMRHAVQRRARTLQPPAAADVRRGAACFAAHCVACHGAPGVAPAPFARGMQPLPGPLVDAAARWRPRELAWITRHGIRMSGMPPWQGRLADEDIWHLVAWLGRLPQVAPADWAAMVHEPCALRDDVPAASAEAAIRRHGCEGCHVIPGIAGSDRHVGPPLAGFGRRTLVAGRLPNTEAALAAWIRDPQHVKPGSAMPSQDVGEADARLIAAHLRALR